MNFGQRIREIRLQQGFSLRKFAKIAELSPAYISVIETSYKIPSEKRIKIIAGALGIDPDDLLHAGGKISSDLTDIILKSPKEFALAIRAMSKLTPQQIEKMANALSSKVQ